MVDPAALDELRAFRAELHACFTRRHDALFELADALLTAGSVSSLPHLSLEPQHRRGWGSVHAAWPEVGWTPTPCGPPSPGAPSPTAKRSTPST